MLCSVRSIVSRLDLPSYTIAHRARTVQYSIRSIIVRYYVPTGDSMSSTLKLSSVSAAVGTGRFAVID